jgi:hypothetical protein
LLSVEVCPFPSRLLTLALKLKVGFIIFVLFNRRRVEVTTDAGVVAVFIPPLSAGVPDLLHQAPSGRKNEPYFRMFIVPSFWHRVQVTN